MKVVSVKVLKKGTNNRGDWIFTKVVFDENGKDSPYTTLAKGAETFKPGTDVEIDDIDMSDPTKDPSFKTYKIISLPPDASQEPKETAKTQSTSDSIVAQVAFKGAIELLCAKIITLDSVLGTATMEWALKRLNPHAIAPLIQELEAEGTEPLVMIDDEQRARLKELKATHPLSSLCKGLGFPAKNLSDLTWEQAERLINACEE